MKFKVRIILLLISVFLGLQAEASNQSLTSGNTISLAGSLYRFNWNLSSTGSNNNLGDVTDRGTFKNASISLNRENSVAATYALPTVALTFPGAGAVFNQDDVIRFKANATDNDGSVSKVEFYANGNKIGEETSSPYEFDWTADGAGDYTIKARATDNLNGMKETAEFTISVLPGTGKIYRILPLGNSITYDNNIGDTRSESVKAAYRYKLWQLLKQDGFRFDFVGSRYSGYSFFVDANNGGMPGITKGGLLRMMRTGIDHTNKQQSPGPYLETYPADIVLLHIGTNQVNENTADVASILDEIDSYEESHQVTITVILAQIINRVTQSAVTKRYNQNLKAMAEARIANGDKIVIVNMDEGADLIYSTGVGGDMTDDLHPNVSGYEKMAKVWHGAIKDVINGLNNQVPLPAAPVLTSLANNTTGATLSPTLNWNASAGATSYQLQVSTNPDFSSVSFERSNLTETSASLSNLTNNTVYYWRVKAVNLTGSSAWSSIWNFTTAPLSPKAQLTTVAISSNNGNTDRAKIGDVVTVSFTANVPIQEPQVTIAGHTATVSPVENSTTAFIATYIMRDNDQEGPIGYSISFQDTRGNAETTVTTTTNASRVIYDRTAPVLNNIRITSNNADVSKAKVGDLVTVAFTANEPIQRPQVTVAGQEVNISAVESSTTTFTATYTMTQNDQEGPIGFSIAFNDVTGNLGTTVIATTDNSKITFDQTAPAAVISSTINNPFNLNPIPVVVTFSESVSGLEIDDFTTINGLISNIQTQDNKTYTADFTPTMDGTVSITLAPNKVVDAAANSNSNSISWSSTYDGTRPTVVLSTAASQVTNTPFTITFTFSEPVNGFVAEDLTLVNGIASEFTSVSSTKYTLLITPVAQGEVTVGVRADQAADAAANGNTASAELKLIYDSIAPVAYAIMFKEEKINLANQTNISLEVTGAETGSSYYYTISSTAGGTPVSGTGTAASADFDMPALDVSSLADGTLTITFYQQDAAGNKGLNVTAQVQKLTRSIILVTQPAKLLVPIRTTFPLLPLPATVEVTYSDNTKEHIGVTWQAGTYNGAVAGTYILTGTLTLAAATNQQQLPAQVLIEVEPNKVPTALFLSTTTFSPNSLPTEIIGTFTTTDTDDNQHNYTLVNGQGNTDNSLFRIQGNALYLLSNAGLSGKTLFSIRVKTTDPYNQTLEQIFTLNKGEYAKAVADLKIVNAFTPNGDGTNDEWTIPELKFYNQVEIEVFDRSGVRLFHTTNPEQGWDGKDLKGQILKGPFLYLVQVKDIDLVQKGVVTILNNK